MLNKSRRCKRIAVDNAEILYAMKEQIHFADGRRQGVDLLTVNRHVTPFLTLRFQVRYG